MKKGFLIITALLSTVFLFNCGGSGPGAPGSSDSGHTGIEIQSVSMVPDSTPGDKGPDLDVNIHICPSTGKPETAGGLFRVDATMTVTASQLNPTSNFDPFPATVEQCTIVYKQPIDEQGAPVIESWTVYPNCTLNSGSNTCIVNLIDITRKYLYWNNVCAAMDSNGYCTDMVDAINNPQKYPTRYTAVYDCTYMNTIGKTGHFQVNQDIFLADFENCTS